MGFLDDLLNKVTGDSNDENLEKAENEQTSSEELTQLSESKDEDVREAVASNPNCPTSVMEKLAQDEEYSVRRGVVRNPNCPTSVMEKLAQDEDWSVRDEVPSNPNCPTSVLEKLANDEDSNVVESACHCLFRRDSSLLDEVFKTENDNQLNAVASFDGTSENMLKDLILRKNYNASYTETAIMNNNLTEKSLEMIYDKVFIEKDSESFPFRLLTSLVANDNLSSEILAELSSHSEDEVREYVAQHSNTSLDILVKLMDDERRFVQNEALSQLINMREEPKDELIIILENIISNLSAGEGKVGEVMGIDVVKGLTQEEVDELKEDAKERIKELSA